MATAQQQADKAIVPTAPAGKHSQDREATVNPSGTSGDDGGGVAVRLDQARGKAVLFATVTGSTVGLITATIVNVALPAIGSAFHVGVAGRQWVVTGYLLTLSALILLGGALGDRFGRRRVYVIGLVWYTVASVLCALAPSLSLLVAARVMQGVGGALLTPSSLAIIQATFIPADRARAIGAWSALLSIGALTGPPLGGFLVDMLDWRFIFLVTVPLAVAAAWAALRHVPETRDAQMTGRLDVVGGVLSIAALAGLTYAVIEVPNTGATSPAVVTALLGGLVASGAFVVAERRAAQPMLPFSIFSSRQFTWANVLCFIVYAALGGVAFLLVQQLIIVLGYSGTAAGLAFMPVSVVMLVLSQRSGAIAQQIGPRVPLTLGSATLAAAMVLMAFIDQGDSYHSTVLPAAVVFGLGLAAILAPVTATALAAADEQHAGIASGVNNAVSRVAQLLTVAALPGAAGLTSTAGDIPADVFATGFRRAMFITAALAALGAVIAWTTIRNDVLGGEEQEPAEAAAEGPAEQPGPPSQAGPAASSRRSTVGRPPNDGPPGWTVRYCIPTSRRRHDGVTVLRTCWPHHRPEPTAAISGGTPSPMVCPSEPLVSR